MAGPVAKIVIEAEPNRLQRGLLAAGGLINTFARSAKAALGAIQLAPRKTSDWGQHAVGQFVGGLAQRGLDGLVAQGHDVLEFQRKLVDFGLATRKGGAELENIGHATREASTATGQNALEVLAGARAYVDLAGASKYSTEKLSLIARSAKASQSALGDMATVVYGLEHSLGVAPTELEDTIGGIINLSKDGTTHFAQMAQEIIGLAPVYSQFGVTGRKGAIELAAQLQVVRSGFGSAGEAATGLLRIYRALPQHASKFEAAGVQIFEKGSRTKLRSFGDILKSIQDSKLAQDRPALIKAFGRGEADRSFQLLTKLVGEYKELEVLGLRNGVVQEDLATKMESGTGRIDAAIQKVKNTVGEAFTPARIEAFAAAIEGLAGKVEPLLKIVGGVSDALGAIYNFGRDVRGALADNPDNNPWNKNPAREKINAAIAIDNAERLRHGGINLHEREKAIPQGVRDVAEATASNEAAFHLTAKRLIETQGNSESPTDESVRLAIEASKQRRGDNKYGSIGTATAADRYLSNVPKGQLEKITGEVFAASLKPHLETLGKTISDAVARAAAPTQQERNQQEVLSIYNRLHPTSQTFPTTPAPFVDPRRKP